MATVTPNYSWPVPTSTDLVKDGAVAIEALGDAIDATVFGLGAPGLVLVKSQTIGTSVSSVTVTSAFSTTYDNYKIIISGGTTASQSLMTLKFGSTATGYYFGNKVNTFAGASDDFSGNNTTSFSRVSGAATNVISCDINVQSPFLTQRTTVSYAYLIPATTGGGGAGAGFLDNATSYTEFTITPQTGTYTGGTIYVYGYKK